MARSKMIIGCVVSFFAVGIICISGESSALQRHGVKGIQNQQLNADSVALESVTASEVEYVDGPLAPLYDFLIQRKLFKFCKLLRDAGLEQTVIDLGGSWTLFAPTDASFIFLPEGILEQLQKDEQLLRDFLMYHFVVGDLPSNQFQNEMILDSAQGAPLRFNIYGQTVTVSGAQILEPDLLFELGRVYIVDRPLYPFPTVDIISYLQNNYKDIYRILVELNLVDYISSGTFTLLVPEDDALDYLSQDFKDAFVANTSLAERIVLNHILPGSLYIGGITDGMQWETVGGGLVTFTIKRGITFVNDIPIVLPDIPLTNGVIHVLNRVLLPEGIETDCQCKPSSDAQNNPHKSFDNNSQSSFGQPQRPVHGQRQTTRRPGQSYHRQTPRPTRNQQARPIGSQNRPVRPSQYPPQSSNRPWDASRITIRPLSPPSQATRSPQPADVQPDDQINSVIAHDEMSVTGQKRPDQDRTTRYPSSSRLPGPTSRPPHQRINFQPTRSTDRGLYPSTENVNYPEQDVTSGVTPISQTDRWSNRQRTPVPRYPTAQQSSSRGPATNRRTHPTRTYNWNQQRTTQSTSVQPHHGSGVDYTTIKPGQVSQTQRPSVQTTSWQQRQQITRATVIPNQRTTFRPGRQTSPQSQRSVTTQRPFVSPSSPNHISPNEQTFESNRQQPICRQRGEQITSINPYLPICITVESSNCQNLPYNPSDARPLCPDAKQPECRDPNEIHDPSDNRPLCQSTGANQNCRVAGQHTYIGDRRPLCPPTTVPQTGCRDPATPFNPSDRRPVCRPTRPPIALSDNQNIGSTQGCRHIEENAGPQDQRPLCPNQPQQDCRSVLERPKAGDRRPLCQVTTATPSGCRDPSKPFNPSDRRPICRTTRPQTQAPPASRETSISQGCRQPDEIPNIEDQRPICPKEPQEDCRPFLERPKPGDRRPVCKANNQPNQSIRPQKEHDKDQNKSRKQQKQPTYPRRGQSTTTTQTTQRQSWQSTTRVPQSWQSTRVSQNRQPTRAQQNRQSTEAPRSWQTTRASQNWEPSSLQTTRMLQNWQTTRASQTWRTTRAPQIWQTTRTQIQLTTKSPSRWQTQTGRPIGKQPQLGSVRTSSQPNRNTFQTNSLQSTPGSIFSPESALYPLQPQSEEYTEQPQTGVHPSNSQSGTLSPEEQSRQYPSQPQSGRPPLQTQRGVQSARPHSGSHSPRPSSQLPGSYPSQPNSPQNPQLQPQTRGTSQPQSDTHNPQPQSGNYPSRTAGMHPSQPHRGSSRPFQPQREPSRPSQPQRGSLRPSQHGSGQGQFQQGRPTSGHSQQQPGSAQSQFTTPSSQPQTQGISRPGISNVQARRPFVPQNRPTSSQGHQSGSFTSGPRRPTTTTRVPISVTGTSTTPGEDGRRTLYEIVEDPALLIRGRPVKLTKVFDLFHKAGLDDILSGPGPTTVFLPSDDAFATLPQGVVEQLEENPELLRQVLSYHVTKSEILPSSQSESYTVPSLEGTQLVITMLNGGRLIFISGAKAVAVTRANNGIFYVVNQLLYPLPHHDIVGAIQSRPDLSTLARLLPMSGLDKLFQGQAAYTFLAPTDNAFAQLPPVVYDELAKNSTALQEILLNHVIEGSHYGREFLAGVTYPSARGGNLRFQVVSYGYQVNGINIKTPEIVTGTGVIHLVDEVLLEDSDLRFFNVPENSDAGEDNSNSNLRQPSGGSQRLGGGQLNPAVSRPVSGNRLPGNQQPFISQPQIGGLQPSHGQSPLPVGNPLRTQYFGHQRNPGHSNVGVSNQSPLAPQIGHQPSAQGRGQSNRGQSQTSGQNAGGTCIGCQQHGQQTHNNQPSGQPGHPSVGGQHIQTHGQRPQVGAFVNQRQPPIRTTRPALSGGHQGHGSLQSGGQPNDVSELAKSMGLNQFANWISNTGLLEKIHDGGVYTVFAPTDDAVNSLPQDVVDSIESDPEKVKSILQYHIVPQRVNLNSVTNEETASTLLQGKTIRFNIYPNSQPDCKQLVTASGTPLGEALASMGSVQVIPVTQVLYQPTGNIQKIVEASPILQKLKEAVKSARLSWMLSGTGPVTIFAPSDTAFESLSEEQKKNLIENKQAFTNLLKRHMVRGTFFATGIQDDVEKKSENNKPIKLSLQGGYLTVNSIPVTYADITATNGVLHVIDQFLL